MLYLAGIVITLFLVILLAGKPHKTNADKMLAVWLFVIALHLTMYYLFITGKIYDYPALLGLHFPYPLLHGPLLFMYTAELTGRQPKKSIHLLHFLPILVIYLFMIPFFSLAAEEKINVYRNRGAGYETLISVCFYAVILSGISYISASMILLEKYRKSIKNKYSNIEKINLGWLRYLVFGIAVIWLVVIFGDDAFIFGTTAIFVFYLGYYGIRQAGVFIPKEQVDSLVQDLNALPRLKYERSGLNKNQSEDIYNRLVELMTREKLFSDPDLSLATLAKMLNVHPNHLSQVINSHGNKSFYDFINLYRVEEFKKLALLPVNRNFTLLSLAFECGFNSKTSFNRNFKKLTGLSPSEYLQQLDLVFT